MSEFTGFGRTNHIDFGDYVYIEQLRFGVPNESYIYKVVGSFASNCWTPAPLKWDSKPVLHKKTEQVLNVIKCGIDETKVITVAESDCRKR